MSHNSRSVYLETLGCQMNKLDSELIRDSLISHGFVFCDSPTKADIILYNTCSIRHHAEEKVYSRLGVLRAQKCEKPDLIIGVLGCMAQKDGRAIFQRMPHVDIVCGTMMFDQLPELLEQVETKRHILAIEEREIELYPRSMAHRDIHHHAFVAIMRGCDNYCSYCVVPYVRGREKSRPMADVVSEVQSLVEASCTEITLLGQSVNSYEDPSEKGGGLAEVLARLNEIDGIRRIRFVTSHPCDMSDEILQAVGELDKVCEYLHLPAQSGSNRILEKMNRGYTREQYLERVERARALIPDVAIASDFIVGFPGETDEDFQQTVKLMGEVRFSNCFIFKYSPREGTAAAKLADDVPLDVKKERNQILLSIQERISRERNEKLIGSTVEVLVEGPSKANAERFCGRTRRNGIVVFDPDGAQPGDLVKLEVVDATSLTLHGRHLSTRAAVA